MKSSTPTSLSRDRFFRLAGSGLVAGMAGCGGMPSTAATAGGQASTPTGPVTTPSGPTQSASIAISRSTTVGALQPGAVGLSYEKSKLATRTFTAANTTLIGCFTRLGKSLLRIGGDSVDKTSWTPAGPGSTTGQIAPADVTALAAFLKSTGWQVIYGINLAANTPANAASEAAFAASALGSSLYGFEIGNECDLYAHHGLKPAPYTVADFIADWSSYANAIRQSVPNAPLTGPASAGSIPTWTAPFASNEGSQINLLTQHYYRGSGRVATSTIGLLVAPDPKLSGKLQELEGIATTNRIPRGYRLTEANSFYGGGAMNVSDTFGTALWAIDFLLINAQNGSAGVNFQSGGSRPGYTPIADAGTSVIEVRPEYYGMLLVAQIAPGPMYAVNVSTSLLLTAYAVAGSDGATYVVIVNKDPSNTAAASVQLGGLASVARLVVLSGPGLSATTGATLGGAAIASDGTWSPPAARTIPVSGNTLAVNVSPASAVLLKIT